MEIGSKRYTAIIIGLSIIFILSISSLLLVFNHLNGFFYDALLRTGMNNKASEELILIEMDHSFQAKGDEVWLSVLQELLQHGSSLVAFSLMPENASEQFYQYAEDSGKVVFGIKRIHNDQTINKSIDTFPKAAQNKNLQFGLIDTAPTEYGVARKQFYALQANSIVFPGFETKVAEQAGHSHSFFTNNFYYVNFIGGEERLPRVNVERVLNNGLINELVEGRVVLVGVKGSEEMPNYYTPIASDQHLTSHVMFRAFALDSLLSNRFIQPISNWAVIASIVLKSPIGDP